MFGSLQMPELVALVKKVRLRRVMLIEREDWPTKHSQWGAFRFLVHIVWCTPIKIQPTLTSALKSGRVKVPPSICCTHCPHPLSWNKPWVTLEEYLSSFQRVLVCLNGTIMRGNGSPTTDCKNYAPIYRMHIQIINSSKFITRYAWYDIAVATHIFWSPQHS